MAVPRLLIPTSYYLRTSSYHLLDSNRKGGRGKEIVDKRRVVGFCLLLLLSLLPFQVQEVKGAVWIRGQSST